MVSVWFCRDGRTHTHTHAGLIERVRIDCMCSKQPQSDTGLAGTTDEKQQQQQQQQQQEKRERKK